MLLEYGVYRQGDDFEVCEKGAVPQVVQLDPEFLPHDRWVSLLDFLPGEEFFLVAIKDCRKAGDSGQNEENPAFLQRVKRYPRSSLGPRSDYTHVTAQNVDERRQLVELCPAKKPPYCCDSRVVFGGDGWSDSVGISDHGPELYHSKSSAAPPHTLSSEEHGAPRSNLDGEGKEKKERRKQDEGKARDGDIENSFGRENRRWWKTNSWRFLAWRFPAKSSAPLYIFGGFLDSLLYFFFIHLALCPEADFATLLLQPIGEIGEKLLDNLIGLRILHQRREKFRRHGNNVRSRLKRLIHVHKVADASDDNL